MRRQKKKICIILAAIMVMTSIGIIPSGARAYAGTMQDPCDYIEGSNVNDQEYSYNWASPVYSYFVKKDDGYMRVQADAYSNDLEVEYYNKELYRYDKKTLSLELPLFGGFYETDSNYFVVTGQKNDDESDDVEVYRITKYDKEWNKIGHAGVFGANTTLPFRAGSCRADFSGKYMVIRTCHQMYTSDRDGLRHQANVTLLVDTEQMKVLDSAVEVANSSVGYVSHSFNQFVKLENNKVVALDHGDAYPRAATLFLPTIDITDGKIHGVAYSKKLILEFYGNVGDNFTNACLGGLEVMDESYLVAGCSVIQDENDPEFNTNNRNRNVFTVSVDKETSDVKLNWITDYPSTEKVSPNPHLVKINDSECLLMWYKGGNIHYTKVDGEGQPVSEIYSKKGELSDCVPLIENNRLIWYTWDDSEIDFYQLSLENLDDLDVVEKTYEHSYSFDSRDGASVTFKCDKCGDAKNGSAPTSYKVWWKDNADADYYTGGLYQTDKENTCKIWIERSGATYDADIDYNEMIVELEDPEMGTIEKTYNGVAIEWKNEGKAVITMYPKYNPDLIRTFELWVGPVSIEEYKDSLYLSDTEYTYNGKYKKPEVYIDWLEEGTDYKVSYKNNLNAGTATVIVKGIGDYKGTIKQNFTIKRASLSGKKVVISNSGYQYSGKTISPKVTIKNLEKNVDYTTSYSNNKNVGTAKITVKGMGNYRGTLTKYYKINPKKTQLTGLTAGKKCLTVKWDRQKTQVDGYQVKYSRSSKFTSSTTKTVKGKLKRSLKIRKLKANQKYYVKVRTYRVVDGKTYYSAWSSYKSKKTK